MKENIQEIYDKIMNLLKNSDYFNEDNIRYYLNIKKPLITEKHIIKVFDAAPSTMLLKDLEYNIKIAKDIVANNKYNNSQLLINQTISGVEIVVRYSESEDEILSRMTKKYNNLLTEEKKRKEQEYDEYLRLKKKYDGYY